MTNCLERIMRHLWIACCLGLLQACASTGSLNSLDDVMSVEQQKALLAADVILIGEQHNNPYHHAIQQQVLEFLGQNGVLGPIVFEQLHSEQQAAAANLNKRTLASFAQDIAWDKSGWPPYKLYEPLFITAVRYRAPVIAGNVPPPKSKAVYKEGYAAVFTAAAQKSLGLDEALPAAAQTALEAEIFEGHCRMIPKDHVGAMIPVQRTRDAAMAWAGAQQPKEHKLVFIVGSGHARKDYGIPWYLQRLRPGVKIYSIALNETDHETESSVYDQVITTKPAEREEDPCKGLQEHLTKPKS
jgi:uncharacterized iron-regulated protein